MRPCKPRRIGWMPPHRCFIPQNGSAENEVRIGLDMLESLRLVDAEGLSQEEAAAAMDISTATLCRLVGEARRQVACALCQGHAIIIEGGTIMFGENTNNQGRDWGPQDRMGKRQIALCGGGNGQGHGGCCSGMGRGKGQRRGMGKGAMNPGQCDGSGPCRRGQGAGSAQRPAQPGSKTSE